MKTMLLSIVVAVAMVGQANAAPVKGMQAREKIADQIRNSGSLMRGDIAAQVAELREQINKYNDAKTEAEKAQVKKTGDEMFRAFMTANAPVMASRSKELGIEQTALSTMLKAAPETLLVLGYLRLPVAERDEAVSKELTIIIRKAAPLLDARNTETNQALHKALVLVNSEIGGKYDAFRSSVAKQLEAGATDLRAVLTAAAREVLGEKASLEDINKFLAELAKCKV